MTKGKVYLVGAGPGDPGLLTVKAWRCIKEAQVLVYDRLVSPRILHLASPGVEMVYVGKSAGHHALSQEEISQKLVELARTGLQVVRLKGGDPFVFGRGGEEAQRLASAGIPFEIIPGITSALSVPAYAGIPVTHREYASSLAVITGHEAGNQQQKQLDYRKFARSADTLVFLMGVENLEFITRELQQGGLPPDHPAALIRWGTWSEQQTISGRLDNIHQIAVSQGVTPPAVLVVGEVVNLKEELSWKEGLPLSGKRVVVTRSLEQAPQFSSLIEAQGGEAWEFPVIKFAPPPSWSQLDEALANLHKYSWLVFTSVNGVYRFFYRLEELKMDVRDLAGLKLAAIGPATRYSLEKRGLRVDLVPREYRAEDLARGILSLGREGERVLLPRAWEARETLPIKLEEAGLPVDEAPVYRTLPGDGDTDRMRQLLQEGRVHVITFTSPSTVRNFFSKVGRDAPQLLKGVTLASIGPVTSSALQEKGFSPQVEACQYTLDGLLEAILQYYRPDNGYQIYDKGGL